MFDVIPISSKNIQALGPVYNRFLKVAQQEYSWPLSAVGFDGLKQIFQMGLMHGYLVYDFNTQEHIGFMFYNLEAYEALEIKVIYLPEEAPVKSIMDILMTRFLENIKPLQNCQVLSYPMLGPSQARYVNFLTWYGFKPIGQSVTRFHFFDGITIEIFKKQTFAPLPEGYRFTSYDDAYEQDVIDVLTESFADSVDALWDPRFRSREGISQALQFVKVGGYGVFWPTCNTLLINAENKCVGICLLNVVSADEANIPLIGILKSEQRHKLGRALLAQTVTKCIDETMKGRLNLTQVSATVATGNIPAVKMYRYTGFQEDHWYPHVYQDFSHIFKRKAGQWC